MSTRTYSYAIGAGATVVAPGGLFFYVKSATAALTITTRGNPTSPIVFDNVGAGLKFGPVGPDKAWRYLDVFSALAQVVEIIISDDGEVDIASTVNVAGNVTVSEVPSAAVATPARIAMNAATDTVIAAANPARRRVTIQNPSTNADSVNVGPAGSISTTQGIEIEPGMSFEFSTSAALSGRAVTGTPSVQVMEET